jgi:hypothetical protein
MPNDDDAIRSQRGVVACIRDLGDGMSRLILDDVTSGSLTNPTAWSFDAFYTWREYSDADLDLMKLSDREYQAIGQNPVARLLALNGRVK